jgi:hypothetical protein
MTTEQAPDAEPSTGRPSPTDHRGTGRVTRVANKVRTAVGRATRRGTAGGAADSASVPADDRSQPVRATMRSPLPAPVIALGAAALGFRWWQHRRAKRAG